MSRKLVIAVVFFGLTGIAQAQEWEAQSSGTGETLNGVSFVDTDRGVAVGDGGTILETEDGGLSWVALALTNDDMLDVAFSGATGLIVGDNGTILRTTDAGENWVVVASGTLNNLAGVAFGESGLSYAAGRDGTILLSVDSGATWSVVETGAARFRAVAAFGARAWVVGNDGSIRATDDGGESWFSLPDPQTGDLHDVVFVSEDEGWMVGQNDAVLHTADGGASWSLRSGSIGIGLNTVFFGNPELGWTGGRLGNLFNSTDGALVWTAEPTPTLDELNGLHFPDAFHGWSVGENGTILSRRVPTTRLRLDRDTIEWGAAAGEALYDVVRGNLETLSATGGDFAAATDACLVAGTSDLTVGSGEDPPGGGGFWYLARVNIGGDRGSYDSGSFLQSGLRDQEIELSGLGCP